MHFCSKSLERRLAQLRQASVISTIQCLGWMTNCPVIFDENATERVWIRRTTSSKNPLHTNSANTFFTFSCFFKTTSARTAPPLESWIALVSQYMLNIAPAVNKNLAWVLCPPLQAPFFSFSCGFYALRIDDQHKRMLVSVTLHALDFDQVSQHFLLNPKVWQVQNPPPSPAPHQIKPMKKRCVD